jgi:hypothetical protein
MRCATSVPVALARASGIMNSSETMLTTIWCPATGVVPSRAMKIAMKANPVTSTRMLAPMGTPRRSMASRRARSGRCSPRLVSAKRW